MKPKAMKHKILLGYLIASCCSAVSLNAQVFPYQDTSLPISQRVDDLVSRMTLEEKISQMMFNAPSIDRLGIPAYNWWNECLHGVARCKEKVTVFPQPIGIAASFNPEEWQKAAGMIADEGRAVYNAAVKRGNTSERYTGLTFWTPNIIVKKKWFANYTNEI